MDPVTYPYKGEYVVTVGGMPVFSHAQRENAEEYASLCRFANLTNNQPKTPEFEVKVGQVVVQDRDNKEGKIVYST